MSTNTRKRRANKSEIMKLMKEARALGALSFEYDGLKVMFKPEDSVIPASEPKKVESSTPLEVVDVVDEKDDELVKDLKMDELLISDPLKYEEMLISDHFDRVQA